MKQYITKEGKGISIDKEKKQIFISGTTKEITKVINLLIQKGYKKVSDLF